MKWRYFAERELPRVIRDLGIPCALPSHATGMSRCPRHGELLGEKSRMCLTCHEEAWEQVGRRYAAQGRPFQQAQPNRKENPMSTASELVQDELLPAVIETRPGADHPVRHQSDPKVALERMADVATPLVEVIEQKKLYASITGKKHVTVAGWTDTRRHATAPPASPRTRPNDTGDGTSPASRSAPSTGVSSAPPTASAVVTRATGRAASLGTRSGSMAETQGDLARASRAPLGQIVVTCRLPAAGGGGAVRRRHRRQDSGAATRRHEANGEASAGRQDPRRGQADRRADRPSCVRLLEELGAAWPEVDWKARAKEIAGVSRRHAHQDDDGAAALQARPGARGGGHGLNDGTSGRRKEYAATHS